MHDSSLAHAMPKKQKTDQRGEGGSSTYGRTLAPVAVRPLAVVEVLACMALVLALCRLMRPADPLFLEIGFPWIWLAATVFALRYGAILGVLAGLCIAAAWFVFHGGQGTMAFPEMLFAGGMAQLVITGHFSDIWSARERRLRAINAYLDDSLVALTNNHYLLRVSHERLERDILGKPFTLRDAIERVRSLPAENASRAVPSSSRSSGDAALPNADVVLDFAASGCRIGQASIFAMTAQGLDPAPAASVGAPFKPDTGDALLRECLLQKDLRHLRQTDDAQGGYLVCAPLLSASGRLFGVLIVRQMAFLSLTHENLQLLLVLLSYYADGLEQHALVAPVQSRLPQCPHEFALELARLAHIQRCSGVRSMMAGMVFPVGALGDAMIEQLTRQRRMLDLLWVYDQEEARVAIALLPLTDEVGVNGYFSRIAHVAQTQFGVDLAQSGAVSHSVAVDAEASAYGLEYLVLRCGRHD